MAIQTITNTTFPAVRTLLNSNFSWLTSYVTNELNVKNNGAVGDGVTNDTAAIQATIDAAEAVGGGRVVFPPGVYNFTGPLTVTSHVILDGSGQEATLLNNVSSSANGVEFNLGSLSGRLTKAAGIRDLTLAAGGVNNTASAASTGVGLLVNLANHNFIAEDVTVKNHAVLYDVVDSWYPSFRNFTGWFFKSAGIRVRNSTISAGSQIFAHFVISNIGVTGSVDALAAAMLVTGSGGIYAVQGDLSASPLGLYLCPAATQYVQYVFCDDVRADTNSSHGIVLDASSGVKIQSVHFNNCWSAYNGWTGAAFVNIAHGLWIKAGSIDGVTWNGGRLRENGGNGATIEAGTNISIHNAEIAQNSQYQTNTQNGIYMDIGSGTVSIVGNRIGNYASGLTNTQQYGIIVNPYSGTANNVTIVANDLRGNNGAPIYWGTVGNNVVLQNNLGVDDVIPTVASAASITLPANPTIKITGTTAIATILKGWTGRNIKLIFTDASPGGVTTGGNIVRAQSAVQNQHIYLDFDGTNWY